MKIASGFRIVALVSALVGVGAPLRGQVADFDSKIPFFCDFGSSVSDEGMKFAHTGFACFFSASEPADWVGVITPSQQTIMGIGDSEITMTLDDGSPFSFVSADFSAGTDGTTPGTILVTGFRALGDPLFQNIVLGFGFETWNFNWSNLTSVVFSEIEPNTYLGFDNVRFSTNVVPEPATAALMLPGIALAGFLARRRRQRAS